MKKGFTMIELIFVIVILGILAAVAIPRLNATRADAEVAKAVANLQTLIKDIESYYTSQGSLNLAGGIQSMTNIQVDNPTQDEIKVRAFLKVGDARCLRISAYKFHFDDNNFRPATLELDKGSHENISVSQNNSLCTKLYKDPTVRRMLTHTHTYRGENNSPTVSGPGQFALGGIPIAR